MKKLLSFLFFFAITGAVLAQNTFPGTGNVGIGTATPSARLQVANGNADFYNDGSYPNVGEDAYDSTSWQGPRFYFNRYRGSKSSPAVVQSGDVVGWLDFYAYDGTTALRSGEFGIKVGGTPSTGIMPGSFYVSLTSPTGIINQRLQITASGVVSIDTTATPAGYSLVVNGNTITRSLTVKAPSNWPDYVSRKSYVLPPLDKVKAYFDLYGHLEGVPSNETLQTDGLNVGEMEKILLKKVEELTLYVIGKDKQIKDENEIIKDQQQQIDAQQKINQALQKQIDELKQQFSALTKSSR